MQKLREEVKFAHLRFLEIPPKTENCTLPPIQVKSPKKIAIKSDWIKWTVKEK